MADHFEPLQHDRLILVNAALAHGNGDLLFRRVDSVQIRQQKAAARAACYNNAVAFDIQLIDTPDPLRIAEHIDTDIQPFQFVRGYRLEPRILR